MYVCDTLTKSSCTRSQTGNSRLLTTFCPGVSKCQRTRKECIGPMIVFTSMTVDRARDVATACAAEGDVLASHTGTAIEPKSELKSMLLSPGQQVQYANRQVHHTKRCLKFTGKFKCRNAHARKTSRCSPIPRTAVHRGCNAVRASIAEEGNARVSGSQPKAAIVT